jgi:hypothetical protein
MATYHFEHSHRGTGERSPGRLVGQADIEAGDDYQAIMRARESALDFTPRQDRAVLLDPHEFEIWTWSNPLS